MVNFQYYTKMNYKNIKYKNIKYKNININLFIFVSNDY